MRALTPGTLWDVERFALSRDGRWLAYTLNEGGFDRLVLQDHEAAGQRAAAAIAAAAR